jgi:capsular exopolysaccharide synthesis family protein
MEFWKLYRVVHAKRWLIAAIMLIASAVIFVGATLQAQKRQYQATAIIQPLERALSENVGATSAEREGSGRITDLIMLPRTSYDLHVAAAELLRLPEDERANRVRDILEENGFFARRDAPIRDEVLRQAKEQGLSEVAARQQAEKLVAQSRQAYVNSLAKAEDAHGAWAPLGLNRPLEDLARDMKERLRFEPVSGPLATLEDPNIVNLIRVSATHDREAAAKLYANLICVAFMDFYTDQSRNQIELQRNQLARKSDLAREQLLKAQESLVAYQKRGDVAPLNPEQTAVIGNVARYEAERNSLQAQIEATKATISKVNGLLAEARAPQNIVKTRPLPSEENPLVKSRQDAVSLAEIAFKTVAANKDVNHPDYIQAKASLDAARAELERIKAIPYTISSPNAAVDAYEAQLGTSQIQLRDLQAKLATIGRQLGVEREKMTRLPQAQATLANLQREVALHTETLTQIRKALTAFDIDSRDLDKAGTITISSQATAERIGGDADTRWTLMAYGAVLALIFGIALVVAMDALDNSVRSAEDAEKLLGLPIAGVIPAQLPDPIRAPRITYLDPLSPAAEAYRLLRTDLLFTAEEHPFKSLVLLTGKPGQGATTTVCNLAIAMAQAGKRVILVDADLRRPKLHNIFKVKNDVGLTSLLNDECEIEEALKATEIDNLLLLPSGPLPLNPSELLASPKMKALHEQLKPHTDFILVDTPSAIAFSDGVVLSSFLDAALMVVRANDVPRGSEQQVKSMLNKAKANIIGVVLNGMDPERVDSVHYHYHYYPVSTVRGAINGTNGNGHHNGTGTPLALPGTGGEGEPVAGRVAAAAGAQEGAGGAAGLQPALGEKTQSFASPVQSRSAVQEPFLREHKKSLWKRFKAAVPYLLVAVLIAVLVLVLNNAMTAIGPPSTMKR